MTSLNWIYNEYFEQLSNMNLHYQSLAILIIGAVSFLLYEQKKALSYCLIILFFISGISALCSLFLGLLTYKEILSSLLSFTTSSDSVYLNDIGKINYQFWLDIVATVFLILIVIIRGLNKSE